MDPERDLPALTPDKFIGVSSFVKRGPFSHETYADFLVSQDCLNDSELGPEDKCQWVAVLLQNRTTFDFIGQCGFILCTYFVGEIFTLFFINLIQQIFTMCLTLHMQTNQQVHKREI